MQRFADKERAKKFHEEAQRILTESRLNTGDEFAYVIERYEKENSVTFEEI